jgi:hypothetical protein
MFIMPDYWCFDIVIETAEVLTDFPVDCSTMKKLAVTGKQGCGVSRQNFRLRL